MLNYVWGVMLVFSIVFSFFNGTTEEVGKAALSGAESAVTLSLSMLGMMCLWSGLMQIAENGGITKTLSKFFSPVFRRLFPEYKNNTKVLSAISSNVTANLLGLGNAATPLGLEAMKRMNENNKVKGTANNSMIMFVVLNTASLQLVPTTISVIRQSAGASVPMDITPCIWISSFFALMVGIILVKLFNSGSDLAQKKLI